MAEIFISYKSERRPAALHLAKVFDAYGYDVWYDYGLVPGDDFEPRILAEIADSKVVVVLWCGMAVESTWVIREAREARLAGKYLPCRIESTALPQEFAEADTINLTEWDGAPRSHMLDRLLRDVARRIGRDPTMSFNRLRELDENWRGYGAPSLAEFALGRKLTPGPLPSPPAKEAITILGPPPEGLSPNFVQHWKNAQRGAAEALSRVAAGYNAGQGGLPKDEKEAKRLYQLAADRGYSTAQNNLGFMYSNGRGGLQRDDVEAVRLYRLAADQGNAGGQSNLANMYENGRGGLSKDEKEAVRLYSLAADQGLGAAQNNLAGMYLAGRGGLPKDEKKASELYRLAADQGFAAPQNNLGARYTEGRGVPKDDKEAVRFYRLAADQGYAPAQTNLGIMYAEGRGGLARDEGEAVRLFKLAARQEYERAQKELKRRNENW